MSTSARVVLLASATAISALGNGFGRIAVTFGVLGLPGVTAKGLSFVLVCLMVPQILFVLFGGVIADRVSRFRLLAFSDVLSALAYSGLAAGVCRHAPIPALAGCAAVAGTASALSLPASSGLVPEVAAAERIQRTNSLLMAATRGADLLGTVLGGSVVAWLGAPSTLLLDAVSFAASAVLIALLRLPSRARAEATSLLGDLRLGWREFAGRQWLWVTVAALSLTAASLTAGIGVLGPIVALRSWGGPQAWSLVAGASTLGMLCGAGVSARLRPQRPVVAGLLMMSLLAVPPLLLAANVPPWAVMPAMFCAGLANDVFGVLWNTAMQREVPEEVLARVASYDWLGTMVLAPVGVLVAAPLSTAFGPSPVLVGCAVLVAVSTAAALASPGVRRLRRVTGVSEITTVL
ncbi:MFS transporter [Amycolatopsis pigmentata]|uniref:MFS transporter n=1 Tax=Amycolatopsis pigmentata TaxID=450801 RepID=A0ABW5FZJ3_9PSEU